MFPTIGNEITLHLNDSEVGQILDGLEIHAEHWRKTATFMDFGNVDAARFLPFECNNAEEAKWIAEFYESIIIKLRDQQARQRKWSGQ